jgi:hypothetical protein
MAESYNGSSLDSYLTQADRALIEGATFNPALRPSFEVIKSCLIWEDERPRELSRNGSQFIARLWVVRSFIHQGIPPERWGVDPTPFENAWRAAQGAGLRWPGFMRLTLSQEDARYFKMSLDAAARNSIDY